MGLDTNSFYKLPTVTTSLSKAPPHPADDPYRLVAKTDCPTMKKALRPECLAEQGLMGCCCFSGAAFCVLSLLLSARNRNNPCAAPHFVKFFPRVTLTLRWSEQGGRLESGICGHFCLCNTDFKDKLACKNLPGVCSNIIPAHDELPENIQLQ